MREVEQRAYLLHSRPYKENQLILNLLTEQEGKVTAFTFASRAGKSSKKATLQPFIPLKVVLKGNENLKTLSRVETIAKPFSLYEKYLYSGFYLNELLVRLLEEHIPSESIFNEYHRCLSQLSLGGEIEPSLRKFELTLMDELGVSFDYSPVFEQPEANFDYIIEEGFVPMYSSSHNAAYKGADLVAIAESQELNKAQQQVFKRLMRQVLNHLLDGKPLNSRKLFSS